MKSKILEKLRTNKSVRIIKIITESATFALCISLILFGVEMFNNMRESKELSNNLLTIQNALSTRYLGKFPNFMPDINQLYRDASAGDSIIILEDVLFYGINSAPVDFYEATLRLFDLAANGSSVMISYYTPEGMAYNFMLQEMLLSQDNYKDYRDTLMLFYKRNHMYKQERRSIIDSCMADGLSKAEADRHLMELVDNSFGDIIDKNLLNKQKERMLAKTPEEVQIPGNNTVSRDDNDQIRNYMLEKYFAKTRDANPNAFKEMVAKYRRPTMKVDINEGTTRIQVETQEMCQKMDTIRWRYLGKDNEPVDHIRYNDFKNMFTEMTNVMEETYRRYPSIKLVPIDDFLSVRSWLVCGKNNRSQAVMAFPSRYSSSEIGFYTTDETTREYIETMKNGILINYLSE